MGFRVKVLGFKVWGLSFKVSGFGFRYKYLKRLNVPGYEALGQLGQDEPASG